MLFIDYLYILQSERRTSIKFNLLIDPHKEEKIIAQLHQKSAFSNELEEFVLSRGSSNKLIAYDDNDLVQISFDNIAFITIISEKIYLITKQNKKYLLKDRLYQIAKKLPDYFWKINKSSIVNRPEIERFSVISGTGVNVIMKNGITDYVSRRCFSQIRKELKS